jgi:hypothetical protein
MTTIELKIQDLSNGREQIRAILLGVAGVSHLAVDPISGRILVTGESDMCASELTLVLIEAGYAAIECVSPGAIAIPASEQTRPRRATLSLRRGRKPGSVVPGEHT